MAKKVKKVIYAISILVGTIVGVGYLSLPYVASKVGFFVMLFYFILMGLVALGIHLVFAEVALETKDFLRFPGYAREYFGERGEKFALVLTIISIIGALLAYLIVGGEFLFLLFGPIFGGNALFYTLLYFLVVAILIYLGIEVISRIESIGVLLFFIILFFVVFNSREIAKIDNLLVPFRVSYLFLPYGPLLFAFCGLNLIPEAEEILNKDKKLLKKIVVPLAILISVILYASFAFLVLSITGNQTSELAIPALKNFLDKKIINLAFILTITTTFTSFIALGLTLQKTLWFDFKVNKKIAWFITCIIPLLLFLIGIRSFIDVIGFVGSIVLGFEAILIILMYQKLKKPSKIKKIFTLPLILIFILGIIYQIIFLFSK